ncbi:hypothetical protein Tco_1544008, partial [Tanacetum coccineum]
LKFEVGERLVLSEEVIDDNFGESGTYIQNLSKDFSIDFALLVGQKEFIRICALDLLDCVPELLYKDFEDICRDSEILEARGVLDYINDHLKCFFLLWHSGF